MPRGRAACHHGTPLAYDCPDCAADEHAQEWLTWAYSDEASPEPVLQPVPIPPPFQGRWEHQ